MQRADFPELQGQPRPRRHRRQPQSDRVVVGLKIATGLAFAGLVGVILLWASVTSDVADPAPVRPRVPSGQFDDAPATTTAGPTAGHLIQGPDLRTETANIVGTASPAPPTTPSSRGHHTRPPRTTQPGFGLPEVGAPCPAAGMYSITGNYEPVVCQGNPPVWRRVF
jgi:hypothetical protein